MWEVDGKKETLKLSRISEISFCTTNGSKLYINLDTPFVTCLRDRFTPISKEVEIIESPNLNKRDPEKEMFINI